jgi:hypothetical protein
MCANSIAGRVTAGHTKKMTSRKPSDDPIFDRPTLNWGCERQLLDTLAMSSFFKKETIFRRITRKEGLTRKNGNFSNKREE